MEIFWLKLSSVQYNDFLEDIKKHILSTSNAQKIIFTPNPEICLKYKTDTEFKAILQKADFLLPDGIGLYLAGQILEQKNIFLRILFLPYFFFNLFFRKQYLYKKFWDRVCGSDLTRDLVEFAHKKNETIIVWDLYNPTDTKKVSSQKDFVKNMQIKYPGLCIEYFIDNPQEQEKNIALLKKIDAKIFFSTLGMKKQEKSILEILQKCKNIQIWLGIGSSFDYMIGFQNRSPVWVRKMWFEWLYRLLTGPQKIKRMKRVWDAIFVFTYTIIFSK